MTLDPELCYRAFQARDRRFEGRFFAAVTSTGIYCRPGCPARLPRRSHLRFFPSAAAAEEGGFRPCLRCRPDTAAAPVLDGTAATVRRALRLIGDGALDDGDVEQLSARLGVTSRHLRRLFDEHLGASPRTVAVTRRVHFARRLVEETALPLADIAHGSGFGSLRRFNDAFLKTFRRAPRTFRRARAPARAAVAGIELRVPVREPYDWTGTLAFLASRAIPGVECVERRVYRRSFACDGTEAGAPGGWIEVRHAPRERALRVRVVAREPRDLLALAERTGRLFDGDADAVAIHAHLSRDPRLRPALRQAPGLRVPGAWDAWEIAVRAVLGQQISVAAARTLAGRLVRRYGVPLGDGAGPEVTHLFPTAAAIAAANLSGLGLTGARAATLRGLAARVAAGEVEFHRLGDLDAAVRTLAGLPGIGEWTAQYIAMRALGEPDAFVAGDLGVRHALARGGRLPSPAEVRDRAERWRPWRAYAVIALWRTLKPTKEDSR